MSKYTSKNSKIYYPNTDIPIHKLNLKNKDELIKLENYLLLQTYEKFGTPTKLELNEEFFINLHKNTFVDLYEWSGKYRDIDMAKGGSLFCRGLYVKKEINTLFQKLKKDNYLKNLSKNNFYKKLAYYKCELIAIHPFYEINGRIIRLFIDILALNNGYDFIDYSKISKDAYIECAIKCVREADYQCFEKMFFDVENGEIKTEIN